jgi:hypothetical protein
MEQEQLRDTRMREWMLNNSILRPKLKTKRFPKLRVHNRRNAPSLPLIGISMCPICKETFSHTPQLDHCHYTGKTRGYLCIQCNTGLGQFSDSPALLQRAANYINSFS